MLSVLQEEKSMHNCCHGNIHDTYGSILSGIFALSIEPRAQFEIYTRAI